jgi:hypothetical protein
LKKFLSCHCLASSSFWRSRAICRSLLPIKNGPAGIWTIAGASDWSGFSAGDIISWTQILIGRSEEGDQKVYEYYG